MATKENEPTEWGYPCTLRDLQVLDALSPEVRASVERYIRSGQAVNPNAKSDYARGWEDGVDAVKDEISSVWCPVPRHREALR